MEIFKSTREYFKMAGIYEYHSDASGMLILVKFSQNLRSLINATPIYRNDFFEIMISYQQQMRFNVSGQDHNTFESPTISFIAPLEIQQCTAHEYSGEIQMLLISPELLEISNYNSPYFKSYPHFNPIIQNTLLLTANQFQSIGNYFDQIKQKLKTFIDPKDIFEVFYADISKVLKNHIEIPKSSERKFQIFESFTLQLKTTSLDKKSIKHISEKLAISYTHLSDTIKEASKHSPSHHLKIFLNNLSHTYLLQTKLTASDIAYELGFSSHAHFTNFFKEINGVSPSQFRKIRNICKVQA